MKAAKLSISLILVVLLTFGMVGAYADSNFIEIRARDVTINRLTDTIGIRKDGDACYQLIDRYGKSLTPAIYSDMISVSGFPFFKISRDSADGVHIKGLIDGSGNVIIPPEYAVIEVLSTEWQLGIKLIPSSAEDKDYTFTNYSNNESSFYRIATVDFYYDGHKAGSLNRTQYDDSYCSTYGAYICVTDRSRQRTFYNSKMQPSPYHSDFTSEFDSVYKNGKTTYYHQGTGQEAFTSTCSLIPSEVKNPYLYDRGVLYGLQGQVIFKPVQNYDNIQSFHNGYATVSMNRYYGLISEKGQEIIPVEYDSLGYTEIPLKFGYISAVKDGKFGFLDNKGNTTCDFVYSSDVVYDRGTFATVKNLDGSIIVLSAAIGELNEKFADVSFAGSEGSMAFVAENGLKEKCLIDLYGNTLIPYNDYSYIEVNRDGTVAVAYLGNRIYHIYSFNYDVGDYPNTTKSSIDGESWICENGHSDNTGNFCSVCGAAKPVAISEESVVWTCINGHSGNHGNFCTECGAPKSEGTESQIENCPKCGYDFKADVPKFCPNCGYAIRQ